MFTVVLWLMLFTQQHCSYSQLAAGCMQCQFSYCFTLLFCYQKAKENDENIVIFTLGVLCHLGFFVNGILTILWPLWMYTAPSYQIAATSNNLWLSYHDSTISNFWCHMPSWILPEMDFDHPLTSGLTKHQCTKFQQNCQAGLLVIQQILLPIISG